MKVIIKKIGNSSCIIIPQNMLDECQITDDVNIEVRNMQIIISVHQNEKRKGWADAFKEMAANCDDELVIPDVFDDDDPALFDDQSLPPHVLNGIARGQADIDAGRFITFEEFKKQLFSSNRKL